jgi:hypothetical protein
VYLLSVFGGVLKLRWRLAVSAPACSSRGRRRTTCALFAPGPFDQENISWPSDLFIKSCASDRLMARSCVLKRACPRWFFFLRSTGLLSVWIWILALWLIWTHQIWGTYHAPSYPATHDYFYFDFLFFVWLGLLGRRSAIRTTPLLLSVPPSWLNFLVNFSLFPKALKWLIAYLSYLSHFAMLKFCSSSLNFYFSFLAYCLAF